MPELLAYAQLGVRHITDPRGLDHLLFLVALAVIYRPREWRALLWVVTSFTVGHSITLALAATGRVAVPTELIEFLIPVTIVATCVENLARAARGREGASATAPGAGGGAVHRPVLAGLFGLVHGAGFANYLRSLFVSDVTLPLLGFNLGIEAGQLAVLVLAMTLFVAIDRLVQLPRRRMPAGSGAPRARVVLVSTTVALIAGRWAAERAPW